MFKKIKLINFRHFICAGITFCTLALGFFFPYSWARIGESLKDLFYSFAGYFMNFTKFWNNGVLLIEINPTVNELSSTPIEPIIDFPKTWELFKSNWGIFWELFFARENFIKYVIEMNDIFFWGYQIFVLLFLVGAICYLSIIMGASTHKIDDNKDRWFLALFKKVSSATFIPVKNFVISFISFLKNHPGWIKAWMYILFLHFNIYAVVIEFFSYFVYLSYSWDIFSVFVQIYKLFVDLSPMLDFVPVFFWIIGAVYILDKRSKDAGYNELEHNEAKNQGFIAERGVFTMIDGVPGAGKTMMGTDMALSEEVRMRNNAYEILLESYLKFPNFPWINLERTLKRAFDKHEVFSVPSCRMFLKDRYKAFRRRRCSARIFDYDIHRYSTKYNNELQVQDIWEVIDDYSCAYLVYTVQCSLLIANYSIRTDAQLMDMGNFPVWNHDFFRKDPRLMEANSRYAHILDWDMLRLGRVMLERNPNRFAFGFGVYVMTELNQERKNGLVLKDVKASAVECNQKNDLFEILGKLCRHGCIIANRVFIKFIADLQRMGDLSSGILELGEVIHISSAGKFEPVLPFWSPFWFFQGICNAYLSFFKEIFNTYRVYRSDNTFFMYVLNSAAALCNNYVVRNNNVFGTRVLDIEVESGKQDGIKITRKYYESKKKVLSKRYATDAHYGIFEARARLNNVGINDIREYVSHRASSEELLLQHSFMQADLSKCA